VAPGELEKAHERLREADERIRREHRFMSFLLASLYEDIVACDAQGNVIVANRVPGFPGVAGYATVRDVMEDITFYHPESGRRFTAEERPISRALRGETTGEIRVEFEKSGRARHFAVVRAHPIPDEDGTILGAMSVILDVTEEHFANVAISELRRTTEVILRAAGEGICAVDDAGRTMLMNPAAERIAGWSFARMRGHLRHALIHHTRPDGTPHPWEECPEYKTLRDGIVRRVADDIFWRPDGTWFPVDYVVTPIREEAGIEGAVITFQDVSQRKRLEQELEQSRRVESLGRLAATIAHEFNNVLMGIQPFVEVIADQRSDQEAVARSLRYIAQSVQRGKKISQEILRFTQPSDPVLEKIDVLFWANEVIDQAKPLLGSRIQLEVDISPDVEGMLGDASQLHQVFLNLFLNARDAMPDGGTICFSATCCAADASFPFGDVPAPGQFVHLVVQDSGRGFSPEVVKHLFEPLFTTKKTSGTGLGLALVRQVVTRHGGHVFADGRFGEGAAFHIFLKASEAPPLQMLVTTATGMLTGKRILVVEDEDAVSAGMEMLLEMAGADVDRISLGAEAIEAIERLGPDVVVLDVGLPDISGDVVYEGIVERWPHLRVIFSTGHADQTKLSAHLRRPNVAFLSKPYEGRDLILVIESLFREQSIKQGHEQIESLFRDGDLK